MGTETGNKIWWYQDLQFSRQSDKVTWQKVMGNIYKYIFVGNLFKTVSDFSPLKRDCLDYN